jgi:hypothetical protein
LQLSEPLPVQRPWYNAGSWAAATYFAVLARIHCRFAAVTPPLWVSAEMRLSALLWISWQEPQSTAAAKLGPVWMSTAALSEATPVALWQVLQTVACAAPRGTENPPCEKPPAGSKWQSAQSMA